MEKNYSEKFDEYFQANFKEIIMFLRSQKHDYNHYIQTIYSLVKAQKYENLERYLFDVVKEFNLKNDIEMVNPPELGAIIVSKIIMANKKNIDVDFKYDICFKNISVKPFDLVRLCGNLMDNAIEAAEEKSADKIIVELNIDDEQFFLKITNRSVEISDEVIRKILENTYSSKGNERGLGLYIVKDIVYKYKGKVTATSDNKEGTSFEVSIPNNI